MMTARGLWIVEKLIQFFWENFAVFCLELQKMVGDDSVLYIIWDRALIRYGSELFWRPINKLNSEILSIRVFCCQTSYQP